MRCSNSPQIFPPVGELSVCLKRESLLLFFRTVHREAPFRLLYPLHPGVALQ